MDVVFAALFFIFCVGLSGLGFCLFVGSLIMTLVRGWKRAFRADSAGHWPLPRRLLLTCSLLFIIPVIGWSGWLSYYYSETQQFSRAMRYLGVPLPRNARNVRTQIGPFSPDHHVFYIFASDLSGIKTFVKAYAGASLDELPDQPDSSRKSILSAGVQRSKDFPWKADYIENGRYFDGRKSNGMVAVDMDNHIVYIVK